MPRTDSRGGRTARALPWPAALVLWCLCCVARQATSDPRAAFWMLDACTAAQAGPGAWETALAWGLHSRWHGPARLDRQRLPDACGPAALASILRHSGVRVRQELLWSMCRLPGGGTSLERLAAAARAFGLDCSTRYDSDLHLLALPAVVHLRRRHFVVLSHLDSGRAEITDPTCGAVVVPAPELLRQASGAALEVRERGAGGRSSP